MSFDRFAYVWNNPLMHVDPSGEFIDGIKRFFKKFSKIITFVAQIIVAVVVTSLTAGMASAFWAGAIIGGATGFTGGFVRTLTQGGNFWNAIVAGGREGLIGAGMGFASAGISNPLNQSFSAAGRSSFSNTGLGRALSKLGSQKFIELNTSVVVRGAVAFAAQAVNQYIFINVHDKPNSDLSGQPDMDHTQQLSFSSQSNQDLHNYSLSEPKNDYSSFGNLNLENIEGFLDYTIDNIIGDVSGNLITRNIGTISIHSVGIDSVETKDEEENPDPKEEDDPKEEEEENDCNKALVCPQGQVFDAKSCSCKTECLTTSGYLHTDAFGENVGLGLQTVVTTDNFRDALGAIIASANCDTGKIFKNDVVNVLSSIPEVRTFVRADGSTASSTYYPIEFKNCDGNLPQNEDYDPEKPCADCDGGNPLRNMEITSPGISGKEGGTFGCTRNGSICNGTIGKKWHDGLDLTADPNTNVFATHFGKVHSIRDTFAAGEYLEESYGNYVIIETEIEGEIHFIKFNHLNEVWVKKDDIIDIGDVIGLSGNTGNANSPLNPSTPHIHLQTFDSNWGSLNPMGFIFTIFSEDFESINNNCN